MAADDLNKLPIGPKDREELTAKLARVVEPLFKLRLKQLQSDTQKMMSSRMLFA